MYHSRFCSPRLWHLLVIVLFISLQSSLISLKSSFDLLENRSLICLKIFLRSAWKSPLFSSKASFDLLESVFCSARNRLSFCLNHNVGKCSLKVIPRVVIPWRWIPSIQQSRIPVSALDSTNYPIIVRFDQMFSNLEYTFSISTST